ncbi:hypothetical protein [Marinactinospora rubrisoli]|uniref:hypothetical protein n=1 Tax=Marinactinospora rubrisoli TaxID=2715399 RepID=UPI0036D32EF4
MTFGENNHRGDHGSRCPDHGEYGALKSQSRLCAASKSGPEFFFDNQLKNDGDRLARDALWRTTSGFAALSRTNAISIGERKSNLERPAMKTEAFNSSRICSDLRE